MPSLCPPPCPPVLEGSSICWVVPVRLQEGTAGLNTAMSPQKEGAGEAMGLDVHAGESFYQYGGDPGSFILGHRYRASREDEVASPLVTASQPTKVMGPEIPSGGHVAT